MRLRNLVWMLTALIVVAPPIATAQDRADCVVIILDASGSMDAKMPGGVKKIDAAKAALQSVLTRIPETTHVGLLVFSGTNVPTPWLYPLGPRDNDALAKAIGLPRPGGNTPLGRFIKTGADRLLEERTKQYGYGSYRLLVVTDGEATDGSLTEQYTPDIIARGITMDVIGVNMKRDHTLATKVHSYRRADDPAALQKALSEILAEVNVSDGDTAAAEAFDLLAPLPAELCGSMIQALAQVNNQPIGQKAAAELEQVRNRVAQRRQQRQQPQPVPPAKDDKEFPFGTLVVGVVIFVILLRALRTRGRR
ncbi:MAG TPA: vWA domain-containing protein [Candidatus Bathyarchaeia archaeon]|nr:vWA domain-containing protein [Candidatus Bathyarchaeia archaeon]